MQVVQFGRSGSFAPAAAPVSGVRAAEAEDKLQPRASPSFPGAACSQWTRARSKKCSHSTLKRVIMSPLGFALSAEGIRPSLNIGTCTTALYILPYLDQLSCSSR